MVAFSFTPDEVSTQVEHGVPSVKSRIEAMHRLAGLGWKLGLRIDPLLDCKDFEKRYCQLFKDIFAEVPEHAIHSISVGAFRMPSSFYKKIEKQYQDEPFFAGNFATQKNISPTCRIKNIASSKPACTFWKNGSIRRRSLPAKLKPLEPLELSGFFLFFIW